MTEFSMVASLLGLLLTIVGYMATNALSKITDLEKEVQRKLYIARFEAETAKGYVRTDIHFDLLRSDIHDMGAKFECKIDKANDKLSTHLEHHD